MGGGLVDWLKNGPRTKHGYAAMVVAYFVAGFLGLLVGAKASVLLGFGLGIYFAYKMAGMSFPRTY